MKAQARARDLIIETALRLFADKGFHHTSPEDIVKASKVSKGLILFHFGSMEGVLKETIRLLLLHLDALLPQDKTLPPTASLNQFIQQFIQSLQDQSDLWRLYASLVQQKDTQSLFMNSGGHAFFEKYKDELRRIFSEMETEDIEGSIAFFEQCRMGIFWEWLVATETYSLDVMAKLWRKNLGIA